MSDKDTGGPAFPCEVVPTGYGTMIHEGMTLRDYFAAKAMVGVIDFGKTLEGFHENKAPDLIAKLSYQLADAMIQARKQ